MAASQYGRVFNNIQTQVAAPYSAGSGVLTVASTAGMSLNPSEFLRITTLRSGLVLSILEVTAISGNNLTVSGSLEGTTDVNLLVGDDIEMRPTAGTFGDIQGTLDNLIAPYSPINAGAIWYDDGTGYAVNGTTLTFSTSTSTLNAANLAVAGKAGFNGATPQAKAATPVTLADVIAILQAYGMSH